MKLAVEAYLGKGDRDQARGRLELYKLLNPGDPEVEELEARVEGREAPSPETASTTGARPAGADAADAEPEVDDEPAADAASFSATAAWPGLPDDAEAASAPGATAGSGRTGSGGTEEEESRSPGSMSEEPATDRVDARGVRRRMVRRRGARHRESRCCGGRDARRGSPGAMEAGHDEPFGDLTAQGDRRRYLAALGAEGIFPVELEPEPAFELEPTSEATVTDGAVPDVVRRRPSPMSGDSTTRIRRPPTRAGTTTRSPSTSRAWRPPPPTIGPR